MVGNVDSFRGFLLAFLTDKARDGTKWKLGITSAGKTWKLRPSDVASDGKLALLSL